MHSPSMHSHFVACTPQLLMRCSTASPATPCLVASRTMSTLATLPPLTRCMTMAHMPAELPLGHVSALLPWLNLAPVEWYSSSNATCTQHHALCLTSWCSVWLLSSSGKPALVPGRVTWQLPFSTLSLTLKTSRKSVCHEPMTDTASMEYHHLRTACNRYTDLQGVQRHKRKVSASLS